MDNETIGRRWVTPNIQFENKFSYISSICVEKHFSLNLKVSYKNLFYQNLRNLLQAHWNITLCKNFSIFFIFCFMSPLYSLKTVQSRHLTKENHTTFRAFFLSELSQHNFFSRLTIAVCRLPPLSAVPCPPMHLDWSRQSIAPQLHGSARSIFTAALSAGITLALIAIAVASRLTICSRRRVTPEPLLGPGVGFQPEGGTYGLRYGDAHMSPNGEIAGALEVGVLEAASFRFLLTLVVLSCADSLEDPLLCLARAESASQPDICNKPATAYAAHAPPTGLARRVAVLFALIDATWLLSGKFSWADRWSFFFSC